MIKKILSALVLLFFVFNLAGPSYSVSAKKTKKNKTNITRKVRPKKTKAKKAKITKKAKPAKAGKPAKKKAKAKPAKKSVKAAYLGKPVFPVFKTAEEIDLLVPPPPAEYEEIIPVTPEASPRLVGKSNFALESGFGGGGIILELGYQRKISDKINYTAGLGYAIGNQYGVVILDVARVHSDLGSYVIGGGLNYAMYSSLVSGVLGLSGTIPSKNILGLELFWGKRFAFQGHEAVGMVGYNTALGLRLTASFEF